MKGDVTAIHVFQKQRHALNDLFGDARSAELLR
jgi:hypothetical protein